MTTGGPTAGQQALGFLTVVDIDQQGLQGGFLVLNRSGRPLEFHCTAPVRTNRAQQILFGASLAPFLYGEHIGQTLIKKSQIEVAAIITDRSPVLAVAEFVNVPVLLVQAAQGTADFGHTASARVDGKHNKKVPTPVIRHGNHQLWSSQSSIDCQSALVGVPESFDLEEPFSRIREALQESVRLAK